MSEPAKPSGLKLPMKIGRPCASSLPKPAVPQSPKTNGDTSTVRKLSNDMAKKKFIDLDGGMMDLSLGRRLSIDRKSSQGSDSLWADVRKLSEAGIRRASDSSIVLTEDTDSFIIGDRVWVGGTKPGQIAYIGDTQFAPGEWAGIVLDEPIGKNDGSVAGIRYFQCENRKGIFSRLTRLSRRPLTTNEDGSVTPVITPPVVSPGSSMSRIASPVSPTASMAMSTSHTSPRGTELKVGDRVIVMNSNAGSKAGMLRFIGTTQFAPGEWCGVELDDPLGKNDGSVQGVRYFECQDKFGLFAPIHKVSLSPSSSRRPSCAMHHGGLKKFGSKESVNSMASTTSVRSSARVRLGVASLSKKPPSHSVAATPTGPKRTPLQDIIKEKDIYIEQLLKERDLEKSETIVAASRVEAAEHKFDVLHQEYVQFREEVEARNVDMQAFVKHLQDQNKELAGLLEDERKRSEDLQFRYEEESINKSEIEQKMPQEVQVSHQTKEDKIAELEQVIKDERARIEKLEKESNKLFEAEEMIAKLRVTQEERDDKLSHLQAANEVADKLVEQFKEQLDLLNAQFEETQSLNRKQEEEIMQLSSTIETSKVLAAKKQDELTLKYTIEIESLNKKIANFESKGKENETKEENIMKELEDIKAFSTKEIERLKNLHGSEVERMQKCLSELEESNRNNEGTLKTLNSELESVKDILKKERLEADAKVQNLTQQINKLEETCGEKEEKISGLNEMLSKLESLIKDKDEESKAVKESAITTENNLKKEVERLSSEIKIKEKDFADKFEEEKKSAGDATNALKEVELKMRNEIELISIKLKEKETELNGVQSNMELKQVEYNNALKEKEDRYTEIKRELDDKNGDLTAQIESLSKELSESQNAVNKNEVVISKLTKELEDQKNLSVRNSEELKKRHANELEKLQQLVAETELKAQNYENCFKNENTEFNEIKAVFKKENEDAKNKIINLEKELSSFEEKYAKQEEELRTLEQELLKMENAVQLKDDENLNLKKSANETECILKKQVEDLENKIKCNESEFKLKEESQQFELIETRKILEKAQNDCLHSQNKSNDFETQLQKTKDKMETIIKESDSKISGLNNEFELKRKDYETVINKKEEEISELGKSNQEITNKNVELNDRCNNYEKQFKEKDVVIENLRKELEQSRTCTVNLKKELEESKTNALNSDEVKTLFMNEIDSLKSSLADSEVKAKEFENRNKELDTLIMDFGKTNADNLNNLIQLEEQLRLSRDLCENKAKEISNMTEKVSTLENTIKLKNDEISNLNNSSTKIENDFRTEIESIKSEFKIKENEFKNRETTLTTTIGNLETRIKEGQSKFTELETKNKHVEFELKKTTDQLNIEVQDKEKLALTLNSVKLNVTDHEQLLNDEKSKFININNELEKSKLEMAEQHKVLQDLRQRLSENDQRFNTQRQLVAQQEQDILALKGNVESSRKQIGSLTSEVTDWKNKFKASKEECSLLNEQKLKIEKDLESLRNSASNIGAVQQQSSVKNETISNGNDDIDYRQQIDFMNSIIVELQNKNEALVARISYLETGELPSATNGNRNEPKVLRMYCDICEVFDAHETEDCPRQAMDSPPPQQVHKPLPRGYQRPYCDNCEIFGHLTDDCEVDLTF